MKYMLFVLILFLSACSENENHHNHSQIDQSLEMPQLVSNGKVFFMTPKSGEILSSEFDLKFGVENLEVVPAGQGLGDGRKGHHHIIINHGPIPYGQIVPKDKNHIHFGKGQTEVKLKLDPGHYQLTLQFADAIHRSYGPELSETIKIEIK